MFSVLLRLTALLNERAEFLGILQKDFNTLRLEDPIAVEHMVTKVLYRNATPMTRIPQNVYWSTA